VNKKILCVDDDKTILEAYQRRLRKTVELDIAVGPTEGLEAMKTRGPYAVVVADFRMPEMNGVVFLTHAKKLAPQTVRMMLSGNADLETAMNAVNEGSIFRFLTKPCPPNVLETALLAGVEQYRLVTGEKELLEKTVSGSVRLIMDLLFLLDPEATERAARLKEPLREAIQAMHLENGWTLELAGLLSTIGMVTLPKEVREKLRHQMPLSPKEEELLACVPEIGHRLLSNIPRLEQVAQIILYQDKHFDGTGLPKDNTQGEAIPVGARVLKAVADFAHLRVRGLSKEEALNQLSERQGWYDTHVLAAIFGSSEREFAPTQSFQMTALSVSLAQLQVGDRLLSDIMSRDDRILIGAGPQVTSPLLERIRNYAALVGVKEPFRVQRIVAS